MALTLITPTRDRPKCFSLLEQYIKNQTYKGEIQWIVVNDGTEEYQYTMGQTVLKRPHHEPHGENCERVWNEDHTRANILHSVCLNYLHALPLITFNKCLFIEDDDCYMKTYLSQMDAWLDEHDLVGVSPACYYNFAHGQYAYLQNDTHASLCMSGITSAALPEFVRQAEKGDPFIDVNLWTAFRGKKKLYPNTRDGQRDQPLVVGGKSLWGTAGVGCGHAPRIGPYDHERAVMKRWLGEYAANYL